jgi:hypothetical protein
VTCVWLCLVAERTARHAKRTGHPRARVTQRSQCVSRQAGHHCSLVSPPARRARPPPTWPPCDYCAQGQRPAAACTGAASWTRDHAARSRPPPPPPSLIDVTLDCHRAGVRRANRPSNRLLTRADTAICSNRMDCEVRMRGEHADCARRKGGAEREHARRVCEGCPIEHHPLILFFRRSREGGVRGPADG